MAVRRIALLAPMPSELGPLVGAFGLRRMPAGEGRFFRGAAQGIEVVASITGIGMRAAASRARQVLDSLSPDHLVVVGVAGGIGPRVAVGDLVVPERVLDLETGAAFHPAALGGFPRSGTLASSDRIIEEPEEAAALEGRGVVAIDMETAAIAAVCERSGCPWTVFRAVSDRADDGSTDAAILGLVGPDGRPRPLAVLRFVLGRPRRIPQLVRLARGAGAATRTAADAVREAIASVGGSGES